MKKSILITFCIPTYNRCDYVEKCVKKIQKIESSNIEILISDNASLDETENKILNLKKNDKRITYFKNNKNIGQSKNILECFKKAKGKYIYLTSDEDEVNIEFFSKKRLNDIQNYNLIVGSLFDLENKNYYIKEKEEDRVNYRNLAFRHYISGIIFSKDSIDLLKMEKLLTLRGSDYGYIPGILMCIKTQKIRRYSDIICYMSKDAGIQYTDNDLKGIKAKYYQPSERIKQLEFYLKCIEEIEFSIKEKEKLYEELAKVYANVRVNGEIFNLYVDEVKEFDKKINKIVEIKKYYKKELLIKRIKFILKKIIKLKFLPKYKFLKENV